MRVLTSLFQYDRKCAAPARRAGHGQLSLMLFDDLFRDGESQPDAAEEIVLVSFEMIEAVEDIRQLFFFDPNAVILHRKQNIIGARAEAHIHVSAFGAELDGVVHQSRESALEGFRVAERARQADVGSEAQVYIPLDGFRRIFIRHVFCDRVQIHRLKFGEDEVHLLQEQDVVDEADDLLDVATHRFYPSGDLVAAHRAFLQHLEIPARRHQRSPQLVRDVGEKLAAGEVLLGKFLIRLGEFARAQAEVVHRHLIVRA